MLTPLADLNLLGWDCTGDIGGLTVYQSVRSKIVTFPRAPPLNPPTDEQQTARDFFRDVAAWWRGQTPTYQAAVARIARKASLRISGYNLATSCAAHGTHEVWRTVCAQAGEYPEPPPHIRA